MSMHYYLYQITNKVNGKIYVGVHKTQNLDDGYMGSGKVIRRAIDKHGLENFEKEILETFDSAEAMFAREKEIVTEEFLARSDVYNLRRGGTGGFDYINSQVDLSHVRRLNGANVPLEARIRAAKKTNSKERTPRKETFNQSFNEEMSKRAQSAEAKEKRKNTRKERQFQQGMKNSQFGSFWITDGTSNKKCRGEIPEGWIRGRIRNEVDGFKL